MGSKYSKAIFASEESRISICLFDIAHAYSKQQESRAVTRKPRDATAVLFVLKFADDIHFKFKSSQASQARLQSSKHTENKTEFNAKWRFKVIQSHVFWSQWKGDKALSIRCNSVGVIC